MSKTAKIILIVLLIYLAYGYFRYWMDKSLWHDADPGPEEKIARYLMELRHPIIGAYRYTHRDEIYY